MGNTLLYTDKRVEIDSESILVRDYYFPFGNRRIRFNAIEKIVVKSPTILTGKYRFYGTGDFRTWFPPDNRTARDRILIIVLKKRWWRIGLTVEDSQAVLALLETRCRVDDHTHG